MTEVTVPPDGTLAGAINAPPAPLTLYHPDGREVTVPAQQAPTWLAEGWSAVKHDLDALAGEFVLLGQSAQDAVAAWVHSVSERGVQDHAEGAEAHVARQAMEGLVVTYAHLQATIAARFPLPPPAPGVTLLAPPTDAGGDGPDDHAETVDPSQVALYLARGYKRPEEAPDHA